MVQITDTRVAALKPGAPRLWDDKFSGFCVHTAAKATRKGQVRKTFYLFYRPNGGGRSAAQRWYKLGVYAPKVFGAAKARAEAERLIGLIRQGQDPALDRKKRREADGGIKTLIEPFAEHLQKYGTARKKTLRSWREVKRALEVYMVPEIGHLRPEDVKPQELANILSKVGKRGRVMSNRLASHIRTFFAWCELPNDPAANLKAKYKTPAPRARTLVRADEKGALIWDELVEVWGGAEALGQPWAGVVKMLALTAQRRSEVTGMKWAEIDEKAALWRIPASRAKNDTPHEVPLSAAVLAILRAIPRIEGCPYVFTTGREGGKKATKKAADFRPVYLGAKAKANLDNLILAARKKADLKAEDMPHWTWHDLRRSVVTGMAELGVAPHVADAILNHKQGIVRGVAKIYNLAVYPADKRRALDLWSEKLLAASRGEKPSAKVIKIAG